MFAHILHNMLYWDKAPSKRYESAGFRSLDLSVLSLLNYFLSAADVWLQYLFTTGEHA
jgi:hypothetical protein